MVAQLPLGGARLAAQPLRGQLPHPEREAGERQPPEQVVEVPVRGDQPVGLEARLGEHPGQHLELVREVRRVHQQGLVAAAQRDRVGLPHGAPQHERVGVDGDRAHRRVRYAAPSSLPASLKVLTSSVGRLAPDSRSSPWRLTQITGVFILSSGSTSVG